MQKQMAESSCEAILAKLAGRGEVEHLCKQSEAEPGKRWQKSNNKSAVQ